jgi:hypothetical protein
MVEGRVHSAQWEAARYLLRFFDNNHRNIVTTRHVACVLPGFGQVSSAEWGPRVLRRAMPVTRAGRVSHLGPLSSFCNVILLGTAPAPRVICCRCSRRFVLSPVLFC